jgi:hypothetical protein
MIHNCSIFGDKSIACYNRLLALLFYSLTILQKAKAERFPQLDILSGVQISDKNRNLIKNINFASIVGSQQQNQQGLLLKYTIFHGTSSLRFIGQDDIGLLTEAEGASSELTKTSVALILLCRNKNGDLAHEVILGVNSTNLEEAEFAAVNRGKASWSKHHPLSDTDDMLHSAIHRLCEGNFVGEGSHTGWDNAKFWAAGGPKLLYDRQKRHQEHPIRRALVEAALTHTPRCVSEGVVCGSYPREHTIVAEGGGFRRCFVESGCWDPFCFVDLIMQSSIDFLAELSWLQELEMQLILRYELLKRLQLEAAPLLAWV